MCRNIQPLFNYDPPTTEEEIHAAALQFVRKVSGYNSPSKANTAVFDAAVAEVETAVQTLLAGLTTSAKPRDRAAEKEKRRQKNLLRFGKT